MAHAVAKTLEDKDPDSSEAVADQAARDPETMMGNSPSHIAEVLSRENKAADAGPVRVESPLHEGMTRHNGSVNEDFTENSGECPQGEYATIGDSDASVKDDVFIGNDGLSGRTASVENDRTAENYASSEDNASAAENDASSVNSGRTQNDVSGTDKDGKLAWSNSASSESTSSENGFVESRPRENGVNAVAAHLTGASETPPQSTKQDQVPACGSKPSSRSSVDLALPPSVAKATVSPASLSVLCLVADYIH